MAPPTAGQETRPIFSAVTSAASRTPWRTTRVAQTVPRQSAQDSNDSSSSSSDEAEPQPLPQGRTISYPSLAADEEDAEEDYFGPQRSMTMVWDDDLPEDHGITSTEATMSLITAIIGAGIMALPQLPVAGELVFCVVLMFVTAAATMEAGSAFFRSTMANNIVVGRGLKFSSTYIHTYEDFGRAAYGPAGEKLIRFFLVIWFVGGSCGFVILMGQNVQNILAPVVSLSYRIWVLLLAPLLWFLAMMRDVSAIAKLTPLGVASAFGSCIIIVSCSIMDMKVWEEWPEQDLKELHNMWPAGGLLSLGSLTATVFGAFACIANVPSIMDEMKEKQRLMRSFRSAIIIVTALYIGVMVMGYHAYGNFIQSNLVDSLTYHPANWEEAQTLKPKDWTGSERIILPTAMSFCVVVNLIISYPLILAPVFLAFQGTTYGKENMKVGTTMNYVMRTLVVAFTIGVPLLITEFSLVFNLFASICGPVLGVVSPIIFGWMIRKAVKAKPSGFGRTIWHGFLMLLSLFCIAVGLMDSTQNLIASFSN
ncbi:unnamed protein product [Prorocentrum cordatum]|uniref:Amino acid transporter transmembrane domain-containing protein n=1 Tax=Prorocentrum cordatum TaxID=2364126 RepID=A0ABN9TWG7_9DINO|nr:unnamed protein product [Polarella glacialis]